MKKKLILIGIGIAFALGGGAFFVQQKYTSDIGAAIKEPVVQPMLPNQESKNMDHDDTENKKDSIDSIRHLLEGEYKINPIDTSILKVTKNEGVGFEAMIPNDWFCGGLALDAESKKSQACLPESDRITYYAGNLKTQNIIMVNFYDSDWQVADSFEDRVILNSNTYTKQYFVVIDEKEMILSIGAYSMYIYGPNQNWDIIIFGNVEEHVADSFIGTFHIVK